MISTPEPWQRPRAMPWVSPHPYLGPLELLLSLALHLAPGTLTVLFQGHVGVQGWAAGVGVRRALGERG